MNSISFYLKKFKNLGSEESRIKSEVLLGVKSILKIDLKKEDVSFNKKTGKIFIKTTPVKKSEIYINKEKVQFFLESRLGEWVKDLR